MQRVFLEDCGPHKQGSVADFPVETWRTFKNWKSLTRPVEDIIALGVEAFLKKKRTRRLALRKKPVAKAA